MDQLEDEGQGRAMSFIYDQFVARRLVFPPDRSTIDSMKKLALTPLQQLPANIEGPVRNGVKSNISIISDTCATYRSGDAQLAHLNEIRDWVEANIARFESREQTAGALA